MKTALKTVLIVSFLLLPALTYATVHTYYITQNGNGSKDGKSLGNALSVSNFNNSANWSTKNNPNKIDPGDTVYFSGMISSRVLLPRGYGGTPGKYITLDGWEGGTCNPVADHDTTTFGGDNGVDLNACPSAAVIDVKSASTNGIQSQWNSYIIIQDFQVRDANHGILLQDGSVAPNHVIIRRNYVHDTYSKCFDMADSEYRYVTIGGSDGDGNFFYNCAERNRSEGTSSGDIGIDGDDLIFSYNEVSNDFVGDYSHNNVQVFTGDRQLIEYNSISYPSPDACISVKAYGGSNKILRFNKFHHGKYGISISTKLGAGNSDIYVYGNFMYDITDQTGKNGYGQALRCYRLYDDIHFWSNVISVTDGRGIAVMAQRGIAQGNVYIYNNTVYKAGQNAKYAHSRDRSGLYIEGGKGLNLRVANNIITDSDVTNQIVLYNANVVDDHISTFDYNIYYYTDQTPQIYWRGTGSASGNLRSKFVKNTVWGKNSTVENPKFTNAKGVDNTAGTEDDDLTLQSSSPAIDTGKDLSKCFDVSVQSKNYRMCYDDALDPNDTNWTTTPPKVRTAKQRDYESWDKGAYIYRTKGSTASLDISPGISPPSRLTIIAN